MKAAIAVTLMFTGSTVSAQLVYNNGALVGIQPTCVVIVKTNSVKNAAGEIHNGGRITIEGDIENDAILTGNNTNSVFNIQGNWINNGSFTADQSQVNLYGGNQFIGGTNQSAFYDLVLNGSGVKSLQINSSVSNTLNLNAFELATNTNTMSVLNTSNTAVNFTTGFVSSLGNGRLSWITNSTNSYLFPVGSSVGTFRYRPVIVNPGNSSTNTFAVRMANVDATTEGYNRSTAQSSICEINPNFYHLIERTNGSATADLTLTYNAIADGNWEDNAHWQTVPEWQLMTNPLAGVSGGLNTIKTSGWNDFSQPAFGLARLAPTASFSGLPASVCQNNGPVQLTGTPSGGQFSGQGVTGSVFNPANLSAGTYDITYTYTNLNGCEGVATQQVTVGTNPVADVTASGPLTFCDGASVTLDAGEGYGSYLWSNGATTQTINVQVSGIYTVQVTSNQGCGGNASSSPITVTVYPGLFATVTAVGNTLNATPADASNYQWYFNGNPIAGATNPTYTATQSGNYSVFIEDENGCSDMSSIVEFSVGINDDIYTQNLELFPNPGSGVFTVRGEFNQNVDLFLNVTNVLGQQLMSDEIIRNTATLTRTVNIDEFANGVYFVRVRINDEVEHVFRYVKN
ncbi:MAG: hypothetical protein POELPBGB_00755 [Bacteroidia bacterium]|nr:hypothetical protein [Bacteroidia bacterium]